MSEGQQKVGGEMCGSGSQSDGGSEESSNSTGIKLSRKSLRVKCKPENTIVEKEVQYVIGVYLFKSSAPYFKGFSCLKQ